MAAPGGAPRRRWAPRAARRNVLDTLFRNVLQKVTDWIVSLTSTFGVTVPFSCGAGQNHTLARSKHAGLGTRGALAPRKLPEDRLGAGWGRGEAHAGKCPEPPGRQRLTQRSKDNIAAPATSLPPGWLSCGCRMGPAWRGPGLRAPPSEENHEEETLPTGPLPASSQRTSPRVSLGRNGPLPS